MGREEQIEEREVLDSIFTEEITNISETEYRIKVTLDVPEDEDNEQAAMLLTIKYPEEYPDKAPHLDLSVEDSEQKHPLFSVAEDKHELLKSLEPVIQENIGMAMVFTLVTTLKEEAEQLVVRRREAQVKKHEAALLEAERKENEKFQGTPVTRDTFLKWRENFLREMEENSLREEEERMAETKKAKVKEPARMSGRQLWESGLARGDGVDDLEDGVPSETMEKLKVSAS